MIIVGAKGFAKELLEVFHQLGETQNLVFFDNVSDDLPENIYGRYPILKSELEVRNHFQNFGNDFCIGVGNPFIRKGLFDLFNKWGGIQHSLISPFAHIGHYSNFIGQGTCIMTGAILTNSIDIGENCLINLNCTIGHDTKIGSYSELCPGVHVSGNVKIGDFSFIGTGAVILPGIQIGNGAIIGAGSVVSKNVIDNQLVKGIPAK
jgi:sugar O-acyltransferase (sialic acid O-acetyltransferase NeuD family)